MQYSSFLYKYTIDAANISYCSPRAYIPKLRISNVEQQSESERVRRASTLVPQRYWVPNHVL